MIKTSARSTAIAAVLAGAAIVGAPGVASAASGGSFYWNANVKCCIDSRNWTQGAGSTTIKAYMDCTADPSMPYFSIELRKGNTSYAKVRYNCDQVGLQYTWKNLPAGTYHFHLTKQDDGIYLDANGQVIYP